MNVVVLVRASDGACVGGWLSNFGNEYCIESTTKTHANARSTCQSSNAELASITSDAECDYIANLLSVNFLCTNKKIMYANVRM